nr:cucoid [Clogmia albipunctata]
MTMEFVWNNICRACLKEGGENQIFETIIDEIDLAEMIMRCSPIIVTPAQNMPNHLCNKCVMDLQVAFKFRMNMVNSEEALMSYVSGMKAECNKDKLELIQVEKKSETPEEIVEITEIMENPISECYSENVLNEEEAEESNEEIIIGNDGEVFKQTINVIETLDDEEITPVKKLQIKPKINQIEHRSGKKNSPLVCNICGNTYRYKYSLESHMRRHLNEKPFVCSICGKGFVVKFELSRHFRVHTGQKPYKCSHCDRSFSDFGSRKKHERIHTGERPFECSYCGKSFAYTHVLATHIHTHTGVKKYQCDQCGKKFTKSHHLKIHVNSHLKASQKKKKAKTKTLEPQNTEVAPVKNEFADEYII